MFDRAYSAKYQKSNPTYAGTTVCAKWLDFQEFAKWYTANYVEGYVLDKDLLGKESKVYSESTCLFIPLGLNTFIVKKYSTNTSGHTGVSCRNGKWRASISINGKRNELGIYKSKEDAANAYRSRRQEVASSWKVKMTGILPKIAIDSIC